MSDITVGSSPVPTSAAVLPEDDDPTPGAWIEPVVEGALVGGGLLVGGVGAGLGCGALTFGNPVAAGGCAALAAPLGASAGKALADLVLGRDYDANAVANTGNDALLASATALTGVGALGVTAPAAMSLSAAPVRAALLRTAVSNTVLNRAFDAVGAARSPQGYAAGLERLKDARAWAVDGAVAAVVPPSGAAGGVLGAACRKEFAALYSSLKGQQQTAIATVTGRVAQYTEHLGGVQETLRKLTPLMGDAATTTADRISHFQAGQRAVKTEAMLVRGQDAMDRLAHVPKYVDTLVEHIQKNFPSEIARPLMAKFGEIEKGVGVPVRQLKQEVNDLAAKLAELRPGHDQIDTLKLVLQETSSRYWEVAKARAQQYEAVFEDIIRADPDM